MKLPNLLRIAAALLALPPGLALRAQVTAPCVTINCPSNIVAACAGTNGTPINFSVTASTICGRVVSVVCTPPSGTLFPAGLTTVNCVATDGLQNKASCSFTVSVTGDCGPECLQFTCPSSPIVAEADGHGLTIVDFRISARNVCGGDAWVKCVPESGSAFPVGTNTVNCSAGIGDQTLQRCSFDVIVRDVTPPVIHLRTSSLSVFCQTMIPQSGAYVEFSGVSASDNVDAHPKLAYTPASGSFFKLGTHTIVCTATDTAGNQSSSSFSLTVIPGPACELDVPTNTVDTTDNWGFELGLRTWQRSGTAFAHQPTLGDNVHVIRIPELKDQYEKTVGGDYWHQLEYPIGHKAGHWIGTAENHPDDGTPPGTMEGNAATGWLMSKAFKLEQRYIAFLIGGDRDEDNLRVELLVHANAGDPGAIGISGLWYRIVKSLTGHGEERMRRAHFDAGSVIGQICRLRIVDNSTTGHINVDDFRFQSSPPHSTMVKIGETERLSTIIFNGVEYDWDSPVWGLADLHTHPMSHLGLGGRVFHGRPDGDLKEALDDCDCDHGGWGTDNGCGNYLRQLVLAAFDEDAGDHHQLGWDWNQWSRFQKWPIFNSYSHQQMWHEWIRRSYDGGLRVMVALTVHNKLLAQATIGSHGPKDDYSVMTNQIAQLKEFVARHDDFMEIALDPYQLRDIVRNNKLAIIIGSETDDIGNFDRNPLVLERADATSKAMVKERLQDLYDQGLRYMFPVHLTDNKFGGTAIYNPLFAVATKYSMGRPLQVEGVNNGVHFKLPSLDASHYMPSADEWIGATFNLLNPFAPFKLLIETQGKMMGNSASVSDSSLGLLGVGAMTMIPMALASPAASFVSPVIIKGIADFDSLDLPKEIYPLGDNYPDYAAVGTNFIGHRNASGLSTLGKFAIEEMMRLGMIIDLDHMSEKGVDAALEMAEQNPCGYPMNSGHNSFRKLRYDASENNRTAQQLARFQTLGGMMGLGWGNGDFRDVSVGLGYSPTNSSSYVANDSPGSSKTFAQSTIYALEHMKRRGIALGSDINGYVVGPGPRFGPQSAYGLREDALGKRSELIGKQENGVAYDLKEGRPGTTGVFNGRGVDQSTDNGWPKTAQGFRYNKEQRDFFVALRIFRWGWQKSPKLTHDEVPGITENLNHSSYDWNRVKEFTRGLLLGPTDGNAGSDIDPDVNMKQKLAKAVYRRKVFGETPPSEIGGDSDSDNYRRYKFFIKVWEDYEKVYGNNTPMKRCETHLVQWDYNFDGLAHYGLLPDFFQDLNNVGLEAHDMSPMFRSAEDFAQMWTKSLCAADALNHPRIYLPAEPVLVDGVLNIEWFGLEGDQLEEADVLGAGANWRLSDAPRWTENGRVHVAIQVNPRAPQRYFRVRR